MQKIFITMSLDKSLGYMLGRSLKVFKNHMNIELKSKNIDLSLEQFIILNMLDSHCDFIQQDLAKQLQKDKSLIVRQVDGLLKNRYIVRVENENDKRKKTLILTKSGFEKLNEVRVIGDEITVKLLSGLTEDELNVFRHVLTKIWENGGLNEE